MTDVDTRAFSTGFAFFSLAPTLSFQPSIEAPL